VAEREGSLRNFEAGELFQIALSRNIEIANIPDFGDKRIPTLRKPFHDYLIWRSSRSFIALRAASLLKPSVEQSAAID